MRREIVDVFNADTASHGGYVYTAIDRWSSRHATGRQSDELIRMLKENFPRSIRIVDIGCGDGTFTLDIANRFGPGAIRGIEPATRLLIRHARGSPRTFQGRFHSKLETSITSRTEETVAVVRGVLHHLDEPRAAIAQLTRQFPSLLVLEPNGYNPVMKIIEKVSRYHRQHNEKSYWPPTLNRWFIQEGFSLVARKFFCLVPYFFPTPFAKILSKAEPALESIPVVRQLCCGTNLALYRRMVESNGRD